MFPKRERSILIAHAPSVSREEAVLEVASSSRNILVSETTQELPFFVLDETSKSFPNFNKIGRNLLFKFRSLGEEREPKIT